MCRFHSFRELRCVRWSEPSGTPRARTEDNGTYELHVSRFLREVRRVIRFDGRAVTQAFLDGAARVLCARGVPGHVPGRSPWSARPASSRKATETSLFLGR